MQSTAVNMAIIASDCVENLFCFMVIFLLSFVMLNGITIQEKEMIVNR